MTAHGTYRLHMALVFLSAWTLLTMNATAQSNQRQWNRGRNNRDSQNAANPPAMGKGYDAFHMVQTRNIFDPDRRPILPPQAAATTQAPPPTRSDYVALTGIMVTEDKALAFFSGSRADYNKVLGVNTDIAGSKLTKITSTSIEVERDGKRTSIAVGQTVPLDGSAPVSAVNLTPFPTTTTPSENAPPADASDVLRRMMERRQQQLK